MRVTGGRLGGRNLAAPQDMAVRPTSDRARQAVFNILMHKHFGIDFTLENVAVADLFAGTGALGIEALSRGARFCLLVDDNADSRALQRENVEALGLTGATKIWRRDATDLGPLAAGSGGPFGLVFLDPPYRKNLIPPALKSLKDGGWLAPNALLVVEDAGGNISRRRGLRFWTPAITEKRKSTFLDAGSRVKDPSRSHGPRLRATQGDPRTNADQTNLQDMPGIGRASITSTLSPGKMAKCGWPSNIFAAASWLSALTTMKPVMALRISLTPPGPTFLVLPSGPPCTTTAAA